ncbi:mitochondrial substrate carrier family protein ucpB-like [Diadema antillarum]|uniref:mitochondrial substrate carrier family protein ucpB-like n=1 Tax=Diadema antillarum TaxID=105358 RepID=UPI003A86A9C0
MHDRKEDALRFAFAGLSCMCAAFATNPIDVTKIRMQLEGELQQQNAKAAFQQRYYKGILPGMVTIARDEGIKGLYKGVTPSLIREAVYSTIRLGAYEPIKVLFGATDPAHTPLYKKLAAGATSGAIGSTIATPTDLIRVRLQGEGKLAPGQAPRYRGFFHAFTDIAKTEGVLGLYRGTVPTVQRAMILTAAQVPTYDHTKHTLLNLGWMQEGLKLHIFSSMVAGFVAALATSPVDVIKTRVMNQKVKGVKSDQLVYKGTLDCFVKTVRCEGIYGLYKGFFPNWLRIGPHTIVSFILFEQLRRLAGINPL